ncbi:hypothetical protein C0Q70_13841 [Pomacea canaliculata]|uniref:Antistasin-like domain-containing protein n=1 Tax=Pomacea canaliculata TaxID=400727 RepID=A0A2T7NYC8_POMCA|nr:uncharacterized protein LOC112571266 [Pomacea canaliculata]PVD26172.1 hypothetical protein C0Q70_13841 [Pomacea canaliculata]
MAGLVLLLICVTSAVTGVFLPESSSDPVICPHLPCPLPPCDRSEWIPWYYDYHGKNCTGCYQCPAMEESLRVSDLEKRQLDSTILRCPIVDCFFPPQDCPVALVAGTIHIGGLECPGCPRCPVPINE